MKADRHREGAQAANRKNCPGEGRIEDRLYPRPTEVSFHQSSGNKFVDQATEEKPYHQEGQYFDEIILNYDEELEYQLFTLGVLKLWLVEEPLCLPTEPYQKEHKGDFR